MRVYVCLVSFTFAPPRLVCVFVCAWRPVFWLFNGVFITERSIPRGWKWLFEVTPYHRAIEVQAMAFARDTDRTVLTEAGVGVDEEQYLDDVYAYQWEFVGREVGILVAHLAFFFIIALLGYKFVRHTS